MKSHTTLRDLERMTICGKASGVARWICVLGWSLENSICALGVDWRPPLEFSSGKPSATFSARPPAKNPWGLRQVHKCDIKCHYVCFPTLLASSSLQNFRHWSRRGKRGKYLKLNCCGILIFKIRSEIHSHILKTLRVRHLESTFQCQQLTYKLLKRPCQKFGWTQKLFSSCKIGPAPNFYVKTVWELQ